MTKEEAWKNLSYYLAWDEELLGRGPTMKVLSPEWFRDEIAEDIKEMAKQYD